MVVGVAFVKEGAQLVAPYMGGAWLVGWCRDVVGLFPLVSRLNNSRPRPGIQHRPPPVPTPYPHRHVALNCNDSVMMMMMCGATAAVSCETGGVFPHPA
jgi:hypothetical protein